MWGTFPYMSWTVFLLNPDPQDPLTFPVGQTWSKIVNNVSELWDMPRKMLIFWKDSPTTDTALPETNMAPENRPYPKKERIVFQPSIFRCKLLVSGRVFGQKNHHTFTRCLEVAFLYQTHHSWLSWHEKNNSLVYIYSLPISKVGLLLVGLNLEQLSGYKFQNDQIITKWAPAIVINGVMGPL